MKKVVIVNKVVKDKYTSYLDEMFDLSKLEYEKHFNVPETSDYPIDWNIGVIVGSSGSGKSTALSVMNPDKLEVVLDNSLGIIQQFQDKSPEEVVEVFNAVGLSSVPTWITPPNKLSTGERFRFDIAYSILRTDGVIYIDEFTSVVNRNVAHVVSYALQKYIRKKNRKIVLVSCHYDIIDWLTPDWVFNTARPDDGVVKIIYGDKFSKVLRPEEMFTEMVEVKSYDEV